MSFSIDGEFNDLTFDDLGLLLDADANGSGRGLGEGLVLDILRKKSFEAETVVKRVSWTMDLARSIVMIIWLVPSWMTTRMD